MDNSKKEKQLTFDDCVDTDRPVPTRTDVGTSAESAKAVDHSRSKYRRSILEFIKNRGGATCDEVESDMGLRHQTASCFIRFLTQDGLLRDSAEKRPTRSGRKAIVWVSTA